MLTQNGIPGSYEVWRQKRGLGPEFVIALHSLRDVQNFLKYRADQDRKHGFKIKEKLGGWSAYIRRGKTDQTFFTYWYEEVMPDEVVKIDAALKDALAVAEATAGAEVRARREAAEAAAAASGEAAE